MKKPSATIGNTKQLFGGMEIPYRVTFSYSRKATVKPVKSFCNEEGLIDD